LWLFGAWRLSPPVAKADDTKSQRRLIDREEQQVRADKLESKRFAEGIAFWRNRPRRRKRC
jgi:hypothetical protein